MRGAAAAAIERLADQDALLTTIEAIHAAGLDPEVWPQALSAMASLFGGSAATVESYDGRTGTLLALHAHGIPPAQQIEYFEHYAAMNPRASFGMRQPNLEILWDYRILDEAEMDRDPYYCELLPRTGFRYFMSGVITRNPNEVAVTTVQRTSAQGHVAETEIALMARVLPHLRQAVDVSNRLSRLVGGSSSLRHAMDWLTDGIALVGAGGEVLHANRALAEIARAGDGIRLASSTLEFVPTQAGDAYVRALGSVLAMVGDRSEFTVERGNLAPPYVVSVRPLVPSDRVVESAMDAAAIVFVHDPMRSGAVSAELLREVFRLTGAEADLAVAIQSGLPVTDYARQRRLSLNTVYTHLRRLKEKTGTSRLPELIGKLNEFLSPLRS